MAESVSLKAAIAVGLVSYCALAWGIPYLVDRGIDDKLIGISLADYSMMFPKQFAMAEVPFQRHVRPSEVFSDTYQGARAAFLQAAEELKEQYPKRNPKPLSVHNLTIWEDEHQTYTTDIVVLSGNKPGLVIHSSGVHGVEGYAGSAIQVAFLQLVRQFYEDGQLLHHPTVILVHAVNPVGMAWHRRANEHNVDLNRNGLQPEEWASSFVTSNPNRDKYDQLNTSLFNFGRAPTRWDALVGLSVKAAKAWWRHGLQELLLGMERGQYHDPTGIHYGGQARTEPSLTLLKDWLAEYVDAQQQLRSENEEKDSDRGSSSLGAITWVDVHTGGGFVGVFADSDSIVLNRPTSTDNDETTRHIAKHFTASALFYQNARGSMSGYYQPMLSKLHDSALFMTQEFATVNTLEVGRSMILENEAFHHLSADKAFDWAKRTTKPAFYPQSKEWRRKVLERGIRTLVQAMRRSMQLSK